jgi:hypothetical protein
MRSAGGAGKQVIVAGLDLDYMRRPFEPIPTLCGRAEYVTKTLAVCHRCGGPALYTQRTVRSDDLVVLGALDAYEARCRFCYDPTEPEQPALALDDETSDRVSRGVRPSACYRMSPSSDGCAHGRRLRNPTPRPAHFHRFRSRSCT